MKKLGYLVVVSMLVTAVPAAAGSSRSRTESGEYNTLTFSTDPDPVVAGRFSNGVRFETFPSERYVSLTITDDVADNVRAVVGQDIDGDGVDEEIIEFCNATEAPVKITPGVPVTVWTQEGTCADGSPSTPTFGTIEAMFMTKVGQHQNH